MPSTIGPSTGNPNGITWYPGIRHLSDSNLYQPIDTNVTEKHRKEVQNFITNLYINGEINDSMCRCLQEKECKTQNMYFLPKFIRESDHPQGDPLYQPMVALQKESHLSLTTSSTPSPHIINLM